VLTSEHKNNNCNNNNNKTAEDKTSCMFDGENETISLLLICKMDDFLFGNTSH